MSEESLTTLTTVGRRGRDLNSRTPYEVSGFQDLWEKLRGQSKAFNGADIRIGLIGGLRAMLHGVASSVALVRRDGCEDSCGFCHDEEGLGRGLGWYTSCVSVYKRSGKFVEGDKVIKARMTDLGERNRTAIWG